MLRFNKSCVYLLKTLLRARHWVWKGKSNRAFTFMFRNEQDDGNTHVLSNKQMDPIILLRPALPENQEHYSAKCMVPVSTGAWVSWWAGERLTLDPDKQTEWVKLKVSQQPRGGRGHILTAVASMLRVILRGADASKKEGSRSKATVFWTCLELGITRESNREAGKIIWNRFSGEQFGKQRCRQSGPWSS